MDASQRFAALQRYLRFDERDRAHLVRIEPIFRPRIGPMLDDFYARIFADPAAEAMLVDSERVESLKRSLRAWTSRLFTGPFDGEYYELRARIGHRHVEIGLPERFMPLAMNVVREHLTRAAIDAGPTDADSIAERVAAVSKILDLELTIMLDAYHADSMERVVSNERAHVIQTIATGLSRELKNLLGTIHTSVLLLKKLIPIDADERTQIDRIGRAARRIGDVSDRIVEFARTKRRGNQRVRVSDLLEEVVAQVGDPDGCTIDVSIEPADLEIRCSANEVARAIANLIRNSIDAYRDTGRTGRVRVAASGSHSTGVQFSVSDDGPGIPADRSERIFEPLFSTRDGSLGLGLSFSRDVAVAHGGALRFVYRDTPGATFELLLPGVIAAGPISGSDGSDRAEDGP